jgi:uncharacterized membrane protein
MVPKTSAAVAAFAGTVSDTTGAIISGAQVALTDPTGAVVNKTATDNSGNFRIQPPHQGDYTLTVSVDGFQTLSEHVHAGAMGGTRLSIALSVASAMTQVDVNSSSNVDLTDPVENGDTSVMSSDELSDLPIFDNDYVTAMGNFLDS